MAAGEAHTVVTGEDGSVFAFGYGPRGRLGTGDTACRLAPTRVGGLPPLSGPVRQVAAGFYHTGIVTEAGDLLMCGLGDDGRLGLGDEDNRTTPTLVARALFHGGAVLMAACGYAHTAVLTEGGGVYTFGDGEEGQLGHGDEDHELAPREVPAAAFSGERVVMVAAGGVHTVALSEAGHVFTWGSGSSGQLGHNDQGDQLAPRQVAAGRFAPPGQGDAPERVVFVAAGGNHTVAVTAGGRLYTWGDGHRGQLGHGDTARRLVPMLVGGFGAPEGEQVVMAACGGTQTLVVTQDGVLWACGFGFSGQLGLNDKVDMRFFERLRDTTGVAFGGAKVVTAAAGRVHSAAVTEDGALWTWGYGGSGRLGHGDEQSPLVPTRVPAASLQGMRIGRCRVLPKAHAFAFLMGTKRLEKNTSDVKKLAGEVSLVPMICRCCTTVLPGVAGRMEGLMRLCGGFYAWKQRRAATGQ